MMRYLDYLKVLVYIYLLSGFTIYLGAEDKISWPDLSKKDGSEPLVLQLAISSSTLAYGRPFEFYVRLINRGDTDLEIVLPEDFINEHEILKSEQDNDCLAYPNTFHGATTILSPQSAVILKIPNQYTWIGKYSKMVSYKYPDGKKEVKSNVIKYVCEKKPLSESETADCQQQLEKAICALSKEKVPFFYNLEFTNSGIDILNIGIKCCPYSLPVIKKHMLHNPDPGVRYVMSQVLQFLARGNGPQEAFIRDTSSIDLLIDRLADEKNVWVLEINLGSFHEYSSAGDLTPQQKKRLLDGILRLLDSAEPRIRVAAAYALINNFPEHCNLIEERINRKDFYAVGIIVDIQKRIGKIKAPDAKPTTSGEITE